MIATCHRRGAHAMGGTSAQIPIPCDPEANKAALQRVRGDKLHEVWAGHDGTRVAHAGLVPLAKFIFDTYMSGPNQINRFLSSTSSAQDLLCIPSGGITGFGLSSNVEAALQYLAAWLGGSGSVAIHNLTEGMATAETCRTQVWQWLRHRVRMDDGRMVAPELVSETIDRHVAKLNGGLPEAQLSAAVRLFDQSLKADTCPELLSSSAYEWLD